MKHDNSCRSADAVQSKTRAKHLLPPLLFFGIWTAGILAFWCCSAAADAMGFSLLFLWLLLPAGIFATSIWIGTDETFGHARWAMPLFYGVLYLLAEYLTFNLANIVSNGGMSEWNTPEWRLLLIGIVLSLIGIGCGTAVRLLRARKERKEPV